LSNQLNSTLSKAKSNLFKTKLILRINRIQKSQERELGINLQIQQSKKFNWAQLQIKWTLHHNLMQRVGLGFRRNYNRLTQECFLKKVLLFQLIMLGNQMVKTWLILLKKFMAHLISIKKERLSLNKLNNIKFVNIMTELQIVKKWKECLLILVLIRAKLSKIRHKWLNWVQIIVLKFVRGQ